MRIGEVIPVEREIELNAGKKTVQVKVVHTQAIDQFKWALISTSLK